MDAIRAIARERGLKVVEDAAQGLGATYRGEPLGALGDAGCLSFHDTKNVTCGEGGALVIADRELAHRAEIVREKGTNRSAFLRGEIDKYTWIEVGAFKKRFLWKVIDPREEISEVGAFSTRSLRKAIDPLSEKSEAGFWTMTRPVLNSAPVPP